MDPVEIDIRMRQNVEDESKKASSSVRGLGDAAKKAQQEVRQSIAIQKKVLGGLRSELALLEKDFKKVNVGTQDPKVSAEKAKLSQVVRSLRHEIKLEEDALKKLEKQQQSYTNKSQNLETEIRNVRNEMAALKMQGRENTQEYRVLEERLGLLGTAYKELTATQKALSTGGSQMAGVLSGLNAVSGAFTAAAGAMGMVNNNSEAMGKIQTRLQSMMAITIGLQQVSNTLHETSAFRITTVRKAKELWAVANTKVATALGITNVQAQILMGTLTLGLSVAITAAVVALDRFITKKQEAAEAEAAFGKAVADNAADVLSQYEKMRKEWESLGDSLKAKEQYIRDNQDAFNGLGVAISDVNGADNLFVQNTEAFKNAIMERAKAAAHMDVAAENYKKYLSKLLEADEREKNPSLDEEWLTSKKWYDRDGARVLLNKGAVATADKMRTEAEQFKVSFEKSVDAYIKSSEEASGIFKNSGFGEVAKNTKAFWEKEKKDADTALSLMTDVEKGTKKWNEALKRKKAAEKALETWSFKGKTPGSSGATDKGKAAKDFKNLQVQIENETNAAVLAAMDEGRKKKLAKIDEEYRLKKQRIEARRKELEEGEKFTGKKAPALHRQLDEQLDSIKTKRENDKSAVRTAYNQETTKEWAALLKKYATYEDEKAEIHKRYAAERLKIEKRNKDGRYDAYLANLEEKKNKELSAVEKRKLKDRLSKIEREKLNLNKQLNSAISEEDKKQVVEKIRLKNEEIEAVKKMLGTEEELYRNVHTSLESMSNEELRKYRDYWGRKLQLTKEGTDKYIEIQGKIAEANRKITKNIAADASNFLGQVSNLLKNMGENGLGAYVDKLADVVQSLDGTISTFKDKNSSSLSKASSLVGLIVQAGNYMYKLGSDSYNKRLNEQKAYTLSLHQQMASEQKLLELEQERDKLKRNASAFLDSYYKDDFSAALKQQESASSSLSKSLGKLGNNAIFSQTARVKRLLFGTKKRTKEFSITEILFGKHIPNFFTSNPFKDGAAGVARFFDPLSIFGGYSELKVEKKALKLLQESFNSTLKSMGKTSADMAKFSSREWLDFFSTMEAKGKITDEGTKKLLEDAKKAQEEYNKALEEMKNVISKVAGSLGTDLNSVLTSSLKDSGDAVENFQKRVGNVLLNMFATDLINKQFKSYFDKLQKEMQSSYEAGGDGSWIDDIRRFAEKISPKIKGGSEALKKFAEELKNSGMEIDALSDESRSVASKGITQASQDSIDDLLGRVYALVRFVNEIKEFESLGVNLEQEGINLQTAMLAHLDTIAQNTGWNKKLGDIMSDIREIKEQGIKVKM